MLVVVKWGLLALQSMSLDFNAEVEHLLKLHTIATYIHVQVYSVIFIIELVDYKWGMVHILCTTITDKFVM